MSTNPACPFRQSLLRSQQTRKLLLLTLSFVLLLLFTVVALGQGYQGDGVKRLKINSAALGEERTVLIRTPAGYESNNQRYPVLYLTDGDAHMLHTSATIDFLARNGRMSELIVVGITNTDRTRDLSPTRSPLKRQDGTPQLPTSGGADNFIKFIATELIPEIEKKYRVQPYRILAGHSLGGLFAVHTMISKPGLFNSFIAVSPAMHWDNQVVVKRAEEFFKSRTEYPATLYISLGTEPGPITEGFKRFKEVLAKVQSKDFVWEAQTLTDEDHGSVVLPSHYAGLRKVYDRWQMPRDTQTGQVDGDMKDVEAHYAKLSQKFGYAIQPPELLINQMGYQLLFGGHIDDAIEVFKSNVERYPESANVYDSLAEAYENKGKLDLAGPLYEKAQTLGLKNNDPNLGIYQANFARVSAKLKESDAAANK